MASRFGWEGWPRSLKKGRRMLAALSECTELGGCVYKRGRGMWGRGLERSNTLQKMLAALNECTEWGQVRVTGHRAG